MEKHTATHLNAQAIAFVCFSLIGTGCVAIPMGKQTFTTEYPTEIRATSDDPKKTYETAPFVTEADAFRQTVAIGLSGKITFEQPQVQKYEKVSVEKRKRIAFGFLPGFAEEVWSLVDGLQPMNGWSYLGEGQYHRKSDNQKAVIMLGLIPMTVYATLFAPWADSYECSSHHWADRWNSISQASYLAKFPDEERSKIGAWIWKDNDRHPQRMFASAFSHAALFGFHKFCCYTVKGPVEEERPTDPKITTAERTVLGPYSMTLTLPDLGFNQTAEVPTGETHASFNLSEVANGQKFANGTVRVTPPPGGFSQVPDAHDRACLEESQGHDYPVTVPLPAPRLENIVGE